MSSPLTYADLVSPMTRDEIMEDVALPILKDADFPVDAWGDTDEPRATIEVEAEVLAGLSQTVANTAKGGTLDAEGDWLTIKAEQDFGLTRKAALPTVGTVTLTDTTASPQVFAEGALLFTSTDDPNIIYRNAAVTVPASSSIACTLTAEAVGTAYNKMGSTIALVTPLPGLSVTVAPSTTWITQTGADIESDGSLRARCTASHDEKTGSGVAAYTKWALDSSSEINRVFVQEDPMAVPPAYAVSVYVAGPFGAPTAGALLAASTNVQARRPLGVYMQVVGATPWTCTVRGTVKIKAALATTALAKIKSQLDRWFSGEAIKLRDSDSSTLEGLGIGASVLVSQLCEIIMAVEGVTDVTLTNGVTAYATGDTIGSPPGDGVAIVEHSLLTSLSV